MRIGLTIGDPKGIGPEICAAACAHFAARADVALTVFGERNCPAATCSDITAGQHSADAVRAAVEAIQCGVIDAIVTAPINKQRWHLAGIDAPGHTEFLAALVNPQAPPATRMLFIAENMRIALVTTHLPLRNVANAITTERLHTTIQRTHDFLRTHCGIANPRLACLGLNPHAGEGGLLGDEEQRIIIPTLKTLRARGITIDGPFPADTFFVHRSARTTHHEPHTTPFDAIIAMYHDQGLIPIKQQSNGLAVNVTMGLPFIRTSPGHGTAEDIAFNNCADPQPLIAAIECAMDLVRTRKP